MNKISSQYIPIIGNQGGNVNFVTSIGTMFFQVRLQTCNTHFEQKADTAVSGWSNVATPTNSINIKFCYSRSDSDLGGIEFLKKLFTNSAVLLLPIRLVQNKMQT